MSLTMFFCGDIVNTCANKQFINEYLKNKITETDISICNFEAPILNNGERITKAGPHLVQAKESISILKETGFNILSLANNHIYDYGDIGLADTISEIQRNKLEFLGAGNNFKQSYSPLVKKIKGVKIGFISACEAEFGCLVEDENRGGYNWINHHLIDDIINKLRKYCDIIILIAHTGIEEISIPLPEWRARYKRLCDIGVDVIVGHHPHVPQGIEKYGKSLIFYSLGNFYFDATTICNPANDSFSVILSINENMKISYELVFHKKENNQIINVSKENVIFNIDKLNSLLETNYYETVNKISIELFFDRYYPYYQSAMNVFPNNGSIIDKIKYVIFCFVKGNKIVTSRMILLLHNIRIDSHRYIVQRAISILYEKTPK